MLENYTPLSKLSRPNPLFERETRGATPAVPTTFPLINPQWGAVQVGVVLLIAGGIVAPLWRYTIPTDHWGAGWPSLLLGYLAIQVPLSLVSDLYILVQTIMLWQSRHQRETLDVVRLTRVDEAALVGTYVAISQMRTWPMVQIETTLRLFFPGVIALALKVGNWTVPVALLVAGIAAYNLTALGTVALVVAIVVFVGQLGLAYLHEPLWRVRYQTALGTWAAARHPDLIAALLVATGLTWVLRVFPAFFLCGVYLVTMWLMALPLGSFWVGAGAALWLGGAAVVITPALRWYYDTLTDLWLRQAVSVLRRGE
jgi:uncharacterized membrane protein